MTDDPNPRDDWRDGKTAARLVTVILRARCPRCGVGSLFDGFIKLAPGCTACGLDFSAADAGDGPAVFVILVVGAIIVPAALIVEVVYAPSYWMHLALWLPLTLGLCLGLLRPVKAGLIALQYRHKAVEAGRGPLLDP